MALKLFLVACVIVQNVLAQQPPPSTVEFEFNFAKIVPDVLDRAPRDLLAVRYLNEEIEIGETISPLRTDTEPVVSWSANASDFYCVLMLDADAPTRQLALLRSTNLWLVINIPGSNVTAGEAIADYQEASPGPTTGLHRYVFLAFRQPRRLTISNESRLRKGDLKRFKFNTRKFMATYNLGDPVAGNFFEAQFDKESIPLIKRITDLLNI